MAKKIKFPLKMKDDTLVRTIEELRENFDIESLVENYESGKLITWLEDRYYDVEVQKISELDRNSKNFAVLLCGCLGIAVREEEVNEVDADFLKRRVEKLEYLKRLTSDEMILSKVDDIAITQEDLIELFDLGKKVVYLCKEDFMVPVSVPNMTYIGLFEPCVTVRATDNINFKAQNIVFKDVPFIWDISGVSINDRSYRAERLFMEGKYEKAMALCQELVEENNPRAITLLYRIREDFICDNVEAQKYIAKGAELNYAYSLIDNDDWKFIERYKKILKKTAKKGSSFDKFYYGFALYKLGFHNGSNYDADMIQAYEEAARQGNPVACSGLGSRYFYGEGVTQDYQKVMEWYLKAAEQNHAVAQCNIGVLYDNGGGVTQDYQKAMEWYLKAAEQNYAGAQCNIGFLYENGQGVTQDYQKAMEWYLKAAEQNHARAQNNIGALYHNGQGVTQDYQKAMEWYLKAAEQNYAWAQKNIGVLYHNGQGVTKDYQKAKEWYQKAADNGNDYAKEALKKFG